MLKCIYVPQIYKPSEMQSLDVLQFKTTSDASYLEAHVHEFLTVTRKA
jgi:hypothetical protein